MFNPLNFIQEVKQEGQKVPWPTGKETVTGSLMVVALAVVASIVFWMLVQIYKYLLDIILTINF